jgi:integrase/recombinase XerD
LGLRFADVTADGLLIRKTKFGKSRLVPLHDSAAGLQRYLMRRRQHLSDGDHVSIGKHGRPLPYHAVQSTFLTLLRRAGLWRTPGSYRPRLRDLRHAFAVRALHASPAGRRRIGRHMTALATYLGHVNIYSTYWYL